MRILVALAMAMALSPAHAAGCLARSGEYTTALVELYTSEGCSSCPPADRWLSSLGSRYSARQVVPLALHVDYWDYIGWKDPYAKREFSQRQRRLSMQQRLALVYAPQVLLQGADFRQWDGSQFDRALARINARPARAALEIEIRRALGTALDLRVRAGAADAAQQSAAALYVAAYENRLEGRVAAGENAGAVLHHDHVVLEWQGPYALGEREFQLPLLPKAKLAESGVAAFIRERRTSEVLQALALAVCTPRQL